ncbi:SDR family oxidoreductase [Mucilaginibacter phyllosphaerae]|uniref:NAD(P)-dependent dehydrogenase (Short-subunit alcohol dehydrogenase family) n=1 Tax=Mucilaginibacter phyllosphaerae TaxID=1812349 RepID=A0A4Y8AHR7_9SPHI|nr:SDR family oxidoreductase [Mucilaginibacter phyllosphaerae]MBB3968694.1 NAD(P)-dependent dehydrogenase (short-subunit alcohol dehydrogenase family) [Mucilaginibacter phyllosphaerae]TEW67669.1 SDR family oxidoreductase [Mucilaginibacter phyllosphaerae]GGH14434.1 short-chain dehydrogenase [Mucilaginibacter phyllosphaerae]
MKNQKIALITGANRGLGLETAKQLGEKGITVILTARSIEAANKAADSLKEHGIDAYGVKLEVTDANDRKAVAKYMEEKFGRLDILINNAGVTPNNREGFTNTSLDTEPEEFEYVFNTNLFSLVSLTNLLLPLIRKSDAGRIVNLSSILGSLTIHSLAESPIASAKTLSYDASKAALNIYTNHLAFALAGTNIKVNSAHPGWVKTELGTAAAEMEIPDGAKTSVALALLGEDGPTGRFIHMGQELPW